MDTDLTRDTGTDAAPAPVRTITATDLDWALKEGWADFKEKRGDLVLIPFIYPVVGFIVSAFAFNSELFPLIFPLAAGFALVGPIAAAGFYELARRREANIDASWWHFLDPLKGRSRLPLAALSGMLAVIFVAWMAAAWVIYQQTLGKLGPDTPSTFVNALTSGPGLTMVVVGNIVGALFAVLTLAVAAFSFPMIVDRPVDPLKAVATSVAAFRASPGTMIRWGITVALVLLLGAIPLFIGLVVALPVLGYATWHLYTRAVAR